jgi:hypothetical protein
MQQNRHLRFAAFALLGSCLLLNGCWRKEGFTALAPATYLSWTGTQWDICDDANRTRGIESLPGGTVIVQNVVALQTVGKRHILAKDSSGKMYLVKVDEWGPDEVHSFATEAEWLGAIKAAGINTPTLRDPAKLYK